jgi:hypothetical protein
MAGYDEIDSPAPFRISPLGLVLVFVYLSAVNLERWLCYSLAVGPVRICLDADFRCIRSSNLRHI